MNTRRSSAGWRRATAMTRWSIAALSASTDSGWRTTRATPTTAARWNDVAVVVVEVVERPVGA